MHNTLGDGTTLKNDSGMVVSSLPAVAVEDLPEPPTHDEVVEAIAAIKTNKAAALDCAITAEALQGGGDD